MLANAVPQLCGDYGTVVVYAKFYTQYGVASETIVIETKNKINLPEGSLIKSSNDYKIYIINNHNYKRHIFNPDIFNMYDHLRWENIIEVSEETLNSFITSDLYKSSNDYKVYSLEEIDETKGIAVKHHLDLTVEEFEERGYNWKQVFEVNGEEMEYYDGN